jgi:competence ComEA-like helix-hairpin-helix protein
VAAPVAEVAAPVAEVAAPVAEVAAPVAEVAAPVAEVAAPVAEVAAPVAEVAAPVAEVAAPVAAPPGWSGVEESWECAPHGVDLNMARVADLTQLPGVGPTRAQAILAYRTAHGHFASVYDLALVSGIGPALFRRMTGLSVRQREDRHAALAELLTLAEDQRPLLVRIVEAIQAELGASGAVLTNREGVPLATSGTMPEAERYAALGSRFFFRARRHLQKFVARASDCIILPGSTPPLLLLSSEDVVVILTLAGSAVVRKRLTRVTRAMREVGWLLSRRAVVLQV